MRRLYCAYGSNLNLDQMKERSPMATVVCPLTLNDTSIVYKGVEGQVWATLQKDVGRSTPVLIWDIHEMDEEELDEYEMVPFYYRKEIIELEINGETEDVLIYLMQEGYEYGLPNDLYFKGIQDGYRHHDFDLDILDYSINLTLKHIRQQFNEKPSQEWEGFFL